MTDSVDEELARGIESFQRAENLKYVDGIFGSLTYKKMFELISLQGKCGVVET